MLKTTRIFLRNLKASDLDNIYKYRNDIKCYKYQRYEDTSKIYLQNFINKYSNSSFLSKEEEQHYGICLYSDNLIGDLSIFYNVKDNCFTIGITISYMFQHQGYAFELLKNVVFLLQKHFPTIDIVALVEKGNISSMGLCKKLGFIEECYADSIKSYVYIINSK